MRIFSICIGASKGNDNNDSRYKRENISGAIYALIFRKITVECKIYTAE
jgi:hypothetical protein